ncbi:AAA domain-containing protein [Cupriavidus basilensis]
MLKAKLPKDDSGLNVAAIWNRVSDAVKDIKGWEVVDDVVLSSFSFAKYLMWKDLVERTDQLKQSPVVRHLIDTPRDVYPSSIEFPEARNLDRELLPQATFCPLPADSSQLSAVTAASRGKDFVLIGPPGTGKSQTIANLIAQCVAERKRVLFVSEKMAALDVVYRRLKDVGLGGFCLELHSSKARKFEVLEQLRKSWDAANAVEPEDWLAEARHAWAQCARS